MAACKSNARAKAKAKAKVKTNPIANANALVAHWRMQQHVARRRLSIEGGFVYVRTTLDS